MKGSRRVQRVMEITNLPVRSRIRQLLIKPCHLLRIEVRAVNYKELRVSLLKGVISLAIHVEEFVEDLILVVMISQRRVKLHAAVQQRRIRRLKLLQHLSGTLAPIYVVAQHDHESKGELLVSLHH